MVNIQNESYDLLMNGSIIEASIKSYEIPLTFSGIIWLWPILFLFTLILVAMKTESPTMVAIIAILGNVALGTLLPQQTHIIFALILILSLLIWFYSLFISQRIG